MAVDVLKIKKEKSTESICRLCFMEPDHFQSIFVNEYSTLDKWIENLTSLKIMKVPNAPASLCLACENTLKNFESFREMCFTNDRTIKEMFTQDDSRSDRTDVSKAIPVEKEIKTDQSEDHQTNIMGFTNDSQEINTDITIEYPDIKFEVTSSLDSDENDDGENEENESTPDKEKMLQLKKSESCTEAVNKEENPYICSLCDKAFKNSNRLTIHIRSHTQERPHKCKDCDKSFITSSHLKRHVRIHSGSKPYSCDMCQAKYSQSTHLARHKRTHLKEGFISTANSAEDNLSSSNSKTKQHMQTQSDLCQAKISQSSQLGGHTLVHLEEDLISTTNNAKENELSHDIEDVQGIEQSESFVKPLEAKSKKKLCTICNKFVNRLKKHKVIHSETRPYQCEYCPKGFNQKYKLTTHIRKHTKEKPYVCSYCGKAFASAADLKVHIRSHTQERPFKCKDCNKSFMTSGHLLRHSMTHSGLKPFPCDLCQSKFARNSHLVRHKQRVHQKNAAMAAEGKESNLDAKGDQNF